MATPEKKLKTEDADTSAIGYLQSVSPMRTSSKGNRYFNGIFQEKDSITETVFFVGEELREKMSKFAKDRTPITFHNIQRVPSLRLAGKFDIKFKGTSTVSTPARKLNFDFQMSPSNETVTINKIDEFNAFQKISTIKCKVTDMKDAEMQMTKFGTLKKQLCTVADHTSAIQFTIWEENIGQLKLGESYSISNTSVRKYDGHTTITTTPESEIKDIDNIGIIKLYKIDIQALQKPKVDMSVLSIKATEFFQCLVCNKDIGSFNQDLEMVKCASCQMVQKTQRLKKTMRVEMVVEEDHQTKRYTLFDSALKSNENTANIKTTQDIEEYFIKSSEIKATISGTIISSFENRN